MDTVEQLNGTYFYAGKSNLTASELLFMIFCENTAGQFGIGIADFGAIVAIASGRNNISTRGKLANTTKGTSYASIGARALFGKTKFPLGISLPTWLGGDDSRTLFSEAFCSKYPGIFNTLKQQLASVFYPAVIGASGQEISAVPVSTLLN